MAERRMFALKIIDTDAFLEMPISTRLLYYDLSMRADDDGFVSSPQKIIRITGASQDDLKVLFAKQYLISFENGVCVIKDWKIHNYIQKDRYHPTIYDNEIKQLTITENGSYTKCIQDVSKMDTQARQGKSSEEQGKSNILSHTKKDKTITTLSVSPEEVLNLYNEIMKGKNLPQARELTPKRISQINARTRERFKTLEDWRNYFLKVTTTDFLCNNTGGWRPNLDWLLISAKLIKVLEGAYGSANNLTLTPEQIANGLIIVYDKKGNATGYCKPYKIDETGAVYSALGTLVGYSKP